VDPTGHCTSEDYDCLVEWARVQKMFNVIINDENREWTLEGLKAIAEGMQALRDKMGNDDFISKFAGVTFTIGGGENGMETTGHRDIWVDINMKSNSDYIKHETVHELAHIWDKSCNDCMSRGLMRASGGHEKAPDLFLLFSELNDPDYSYGGQPPTKHAKINRGEDWAESLTAVIFPGYAEYNPWDQNRQDYVLSFLSGR
jgi:hypothetical protein